LASRAQIRSQSCEPGSGERRLAAVVIEELRATQHRDGTAAAAEAQRQTQGRGVARLHVIGLVLEGREHTARELPVVRDTARDVRGVRLDERRHRGRIGRHPGPGVLFHCRTEHQDRSESVEQHQQLRRERILVGEDRRVGFGGARCILCVLPGDIRKALELPGCGSEHRLQERGGHQRADAGGSEQGYRAIDALNRLGIDAVEGAVGEPQQVPGQRRVLGDEHGKLAPRDILIVHRLYELRQVQRTPWRVLGLEDRPGQQEVHRRRDFPMRRLARGRPEGYSEGQLVKSCSDFGRRRGRGRGRRGFGRGDGGRRRGRGLLVPAARPTARADERDDRRGERDERDQEEDGLGHRVLPAPIFSAHCSGICSLQLRRRSSS
jgi:hypothetical protein